MSVLLLLAVPVPEEGMALLLVVEAELEDLLGVVGAGMTFLGVVLNPGLVGATEPVTDDAVASLKLSLLELVTLDAAEEADEILGVVVVVEVVLGVVEVEGEALPRPGRVDDPAAGVVELVRDDDDDNNGGGRAGVVVEEGRLLRRRRAVPGVFGGWEGAVVRAEVDADAEEVGRD